MLNLAEFIPEGLQDIRRGGIYEQFAENSPEDIEQFCYMMGVNPITGLWSFGMAFSLLKREESGFQSFEEDIDRELALELMREWDSAQFFRVANGVKIQAAEFVEAGITQNTVIVAPADISGSYLYDL